MKKSLGTIKYLVAIALITVFFARMNIAMALPTTVFIDQPGGDIANQYGYQLDYSKASVSFTLTDTSSNGIVGYINAIGLKPYTTYQFKLGGKPTCAYPSDGNDLANEYIGLKGRWTCVNCGGDAEARNRNDADYYGSSKNKGDGTDCDQGYLVMDFFTADSNGEVNNVMVSSHNSYHVLYCGGGTCGADGNTFLGYLDSSNHPTVLFCPADKVDGKPERGSCNGLSLANGHYNVQIALTEESFHQGSWATVLEKDITFDITGPTSGESVSATVTNSVNLIACTKDSDCSPIATVSLCAKNGLTTCTSNGATATLTFKAANPTFDYTLTATGLKDSTGYSIIYYTDPWPGSNGKVLDTFTSFSDGTYSGTGSTNPGSFPVASDQNYPGAKIWIVPTSDLTVPTSMPIVGYNPADYLWETSVKNFVTYSTTPVGTCSASKQCIMSQTCGITASGVAFGTLAPGATTDGTAYSIISNSGGIQSILEISGTDWTGASIMPVGATFWSVGTWTPLTTINVDTKATVPAAGIQIVNFKLAVPSGQATGAYTQTMTFTGGC